MIQIMKASAGSGKTYSLARKYISLLLGSKDKYAYRHILAVTFTNKATDEMKGRILKELHIMATDPALSGYLEYFVPAYFPSASDMQKKAEAVLYDILHDYSAFAVSTIDRFFQQALKAFSREIGHFASYQVELDKGSLVSESVDRILDTLTEGDKDLLSWLTENVLEQIEQGGRYSMDANLLDMALRLKSPQRQEALEAAGTDVSKAYSKERLLEIRHKCRELIAAFRLNVKEKADRALAVITEASVDPKESRNGFLAELYIFSELGETDMVPMPKESFFKNSKDSSLWFSKPKAKTFLPMVYPFLEAPLEDFCNLFGKEYDVYNTACILDSQLYGLGVAEELSATFNELMKEKNVLCIDDSNTILRDIIDGSDAPFVYEKIGVRYDHYLLDEFQDTSRVQWQNFCPLLKDSEAKGGDNLIVGDVKQSIYRWRGSDWKLLQEEIPDEFPGHIQNVLDTNYRSLANVVNFNNAFFRSAAAVLDTLSADNDISVSDIYFDVTQKISKSDKEPGSVSLTFCPKEQELQKVLDCVNEAMESGALLSEIAVLVRSNAVGESVAKHLVANGISVVTDDSLKVKSSITVRRLVSLMSLAENPADTVNGFLATSLDVDVPKSSASLTDMAEALLRGLKDNDKEEVWKGEILHIQSFMDSLQDYVGSNGNNLRGFLKHWDGEDPSISSPSSGESVRIMTIHKAKGLAFPYVIIPYVENILLYKPDNHWCSPDLEDTELEGLAEGVYDVSLSSASANTLFAEDYKRENFLQQVDNINILYVAMTRPVLGMHLISCLPPAKCIKAMDAGKMSEFKNFSQILYWFVEGSDNEDTIVRTVNDEQLRYDIGTIVDFSLFRKEDGNSLSDFPILDGNEFPSIALNPGPGDQMADVRERGRLKFSADSIDFFSEDGQAGISASNRIKGVVLHEILSRMTDADDLEDSVKVSLDSGDITVDEYESVLELLEGRIRTASSRGWFPDEASQILNETSLIDSDGRIYRPDRVVVCEDRVTIIDYKFGEHYRKYEHQLKKYAEIWSGMGYSDVSAYLWYVHTDEVIQVV